MNTDLKVREQQNSTVVHAVEEAVKIPRFEGVEDDLRSCDSVFSVGEGINDLLEKELEEINEKDEEEDVCANGHNISLYDPSYNNYSMDYYDSLWGTITCIKVNCKNKGKTFGELMNKKISEYMCERCVQYTMGELSALTWYVKIVKWWKMIVVEENVDQRGRGINDWCY